jgi:hypothetical protein
MRRRHYSFLNDEEEEEVKEKKRVETGENRGKSQCFL